MIWHLDGDPILTSRDYWRGKWRGVGSSWPTTKELWYATAHEAADTVTQILSGNASTSGLGMYSSLWREEPLFEETREGRKIERERTAISREEQIKLATELRAANEHRLAVEREKRARKKAITRLDRLIETKHRQISEWERHLTFVSGPRTNKWFRYRTARQKRWKRELAELVRERLELVSCQAQSAQK